VTAERLPATAALLIIDVQRAMEQASWGGPRNNPQAEANIVRLLTAWRASGRPVYHVRHESTLPDSPYRPGQVGNDFKPEVAPKPGEAVIGKRTNSAFIGTDLETRLRAAGHETLVVTGVRTNNSVEATARMAGNLGFRAHVVSDATATVDMTGLDGRRWPAAEVHAMALANMSGEYATVIDTETALRMAGG